MNLQRLLTSAFFVTWLAASLRLAGPVLLAAIGGNILLKRSLAC